MIIIDDIDQNTIEWLLERSGKPTASCFGKILSGTGKKSTQRTDYMYKLAGERISGRVDGEEHTFYSKAMERGHVMEEKARSYYGMSQRVELSRPAVIYRDKEKLYSCSPDALVVGAAKGLEIKCPELTAAVKYLDKGKLPTQYIPQVQGSMLITGYNQWDFLSYAPGLKPLILTVEIDEEYTRLQEEALLEFCHDLDDLVERIKA